MTVVFQFGMYLLHQGELCDSLSTFRLPVQSDELVLVVCSNFQVALQQPLLELGNLDLLLDNQAHPYEVKPSDHCDSGLVADHKSASDTWSPASSAGRRQCQDTESVQPEEQRSRNVWYRHTVDARKADNRGKPSGCSSTAMASMSGYCQELASTPYYASGIPGAGKIPVQSLFLVLLSGLQKVFQETQKDPC